MRNFDPLKKAIRKFRRKIDKTYRIGLTLMLSMTICIFISWATFFLNGSIGTALLVFGVIMGIMTKYFNRKMDDIQARLKDLIDRSELRYVQKRLERVLRQSDEG